jgi:competence protein ComEA
LRNSYFRPVHETSRSTVVIWVIAAALAVVAGVRLFGGANSATPPVSIDGPTAGASGSVRGPEGSGARASAPGSGGADAAGSELYVHVAGAVRRPGLIRLAADARVATALERAGGPTRRADLTLVNIAARVQDGQQIVVPVRGAATAVAPAEGAAGAAGAKIHLSSATAEQLDGIDGIGPTLAERIVEYRDAHGGFRSVDELAEVEGIGEKRLATLRDALQP